VVLEEVVSVPVTLIRGISSGLQVEVVVLPPAQKVVDGREVGSEVEEVEEGHIEVIRRGSMVHLLQMSHPMCRVQ
jgi:hypothetical protein